MGSARLPALSQFRPSDHLKGKATTPVTAVAGETHSSGGNIAADAVAAAGGNRAGVTGEVGGRDTAGVASGGCGEVGGAGARAGKGKDAGLTAVPRAVGTRKSTSSSSSSSLSHHADRVRDIVEEATGVSGRKRGKGRGLDHKLRGQPTRPSVHFQPSLRLSSRTSFDFANGAKPSTIE